MKFINKYKTYIINVALFLIIFITPFIIFGVTPFGKYALQESDITVQFKPLLYNFLTKLRTGTLLNYSFNNGLGNPFIFEFLYYLASPLNIVGIFFTDTNAMYFAVILCKLILTVLFMNYYVCKKTKNESVIIIATLSYVFSGWFLSFSLFNIWLDIVMVFPLFQYGLEKILDEHKSHLYIITLSYMLIANLYLSMSVCVYALLYFIIYELVYKKDSIKEKILSFDYIALSTLFALLISSFYLFAWYDSIIKMGIGVGAPIETDYHLSISTFLSTLFYPNIKLFNDLKGETFVNIAIPSIVLITYIAYIFNSDKPLRNRIFVVLISIITIAIIFIPKLNYYMSGFRYPRGFPYRYSFIISFLLILLFINTVNKERINKRSYIIAIFITIILYIFSCKNSINTELVITSTFLLVFILLFLLYDDNKYYKILTIICFILQVFVGNYSAFKFTNTIDNTNSYTYNLDNARYRINSKEDNNNTLYSNTKSTYFFSSMSYVKYIRLMKLLGVNTFSTSFSAINDKEEVASMLFNVKNSHSNYYLEKIYSVNKKVLEYYPNEFSIKENYEALLYNMTGITDLFNEKEIKGYKIDNKYTFYIPYHYYFIYDEAQTAHNIKQNIDESDGTITIYTFKESKLEEIYSYLAKNQIKYTYYNDNHIIGNVNVDEDQLIFTSIPYDKDWEVKIDGKKVKTREILESLLGVEVTPGQHRIELKYKTHYLVPAIISITSFILLVIDIVKKKKNNTNN